jgi:hypothetical protein
MAAKWFDFLNEPEYRRVFDTKRFRDATEPDDETKRSWTQDAIGKFREATKAAEDKRMSQALEARQREEAKVPAVQPLGIEARTVPTPRGPMTADIQKFREATEPKEAATGRSILSGIGAVTERAGAMRETAQGAILNPEVPIIPSKHPGATEKFATDFRTRLQDKKDTLITLVNKGVIDETEAQRRWEQMPQMVMNEIEPGGKTRFGLKLSDIGLGNVMGREVTMQDVKQLEGKLARLPITPLLPEEAYKPIERIPVVGEKAAEYARGLTTPIGLAGTIAFPEVTAGMVAGGIAGYEAGKGIEAGLKKVGLPTTVKVGPLNVGPAGVLETAGTFVGPVLGPAVERAAVRGAAKVAKVAARPEIASFRRGIGATVAEEAGGLKPRVPEAVPEAVSPEIASFRAATEITPGMSKAERLAQWKAGYKPEAPAAAPEAPVRGPQPVGKEEALARWRAGYGKPPTEPPTAPPGQPPTGAAGQMPERGYTGAQEIIDTKEATLLRPGKATQVPLVRQGLSVLNPSVSQERTVLVAYNARRAAGVSLETAWNARRAPLIDELQAAWKEAAPKYIGPAERPDVLKGTLADFGQNPADYTGATPRLKQAVEGYKGHQDAILAEARGKYGVDIQPYPVQPGGFFVPNVATKESLETAAGTLSSNYTSASLASKFGTAKTRLYESAAKRMAHDPTFVPETNIGTLADLHDAALARMAGNETFKLGAGGKMRLEVMQETHPKLANQMLGLRQRLQSLRGTAGRLDQKLDDTVRSFLENPDEMPLSDLADSLDVRITRGPRVGKSAADINAEIQAVRQEIRQIRPAWENASIDPYVMNRKTFRYYTREQSAAIDKILTTRLPIGQGIVDAIDEIRVTTFGGDISPLTIQGLLGATADPVTLAFNARGIGRTLASGRTLEELARTEPELVRRYTIATGRPLGQLGAEFRQAAKGPERIPGLGKIWALVNDRTMGAVEYLRYQTWKNDSNLLQKVGGKTQAVADAEAANTWSKIMPALAPEERGASALQAQLERTPIISSSFAAGPPALIKDAVSGLAKLGGSRELSPIARWQGLAGREQLAVLRLTTMAGTLATLTTLSYIAAGDSPEEAAKKVLNPATGRFMSIATGKQGYVPIGGPFRSLIRGLAPRYVDGKLVPFAGTLQFLRGKEVPPLATITDLVRGKDFMGRQIVQGDFPQNLLSGLWYAAERHMPLTGGAVSEKIRTGGAKPSDIGTLAREAATQLGGVNFYETSPYEKLTELVPGWGTMTKGQRDEIAGQRPEVAALWNKQLQQGLQRGEQWAETKQETQQAADEFGAQVLAAYSKPGITGADIMDSVTDFLQKRANQSELRYAGVEFKNQGEDQKLLDAYYQITMPDVPTATERNDFFAQQDAFIAANPRVKELIRQNHQAIFTDPQMKALMAEIDAARDVRSEYYSIPAKLGFSAEEEAELAPWAAQAAAMKSTYHYSPRRALNELGLDAELATRVLRYMNRAANPARARFWRMNPDKKVLYKQFYSELPLEVPTEELAATG